MTGAGAVSIGEAACPAVRALRAAGGGAPWAMVADGGDRIRFVTPGLAAALLPARSPCGARASAILRPVDDDQRLALDGFRRSGNLAVAAWRAPLGEDGGALYVAIDAAARPRAEHAAAVALGAMQTVGDGPMGDSARALARCWLGLARAQAIGVGTAVIAEHGCGEAGGTAAALVRLGMVLALADAGRADPADGPGAVGDVRDAALMLQITDCIDAIEAAAAAAATLAALGGRRAGPPPAMGRAAGLRDGMIRSWTAAGRLLDLARDADRSLGDMRDALDRVGEAVHGAAQAPADAAAPAAPAGDAPAPVSLDAFRALRAARAR